MAGKMNVFNWTKKRSELAETIAEGHTVEKAAIICGVPERTAYRWHANLEFKAEVDRLSLMIGIASKAERLRIAKKAVREKMVGDIILTKKELLDWLKFAAEETDEVRLNLADLISSHIATKHEEDAPVSEAGPDGNDTPDS